MKLLSKWRWILSTLAAVSVGLLSVLPCPEASSLKRDEEVIIFNTSAANNSEDNAWDIPIHGWIFERETDSVWRKAVVADLLEILEFDSEVTHQDLFQSAQETKPPRIEAILNRYRQRSFILIGDSGEKDPEVYGTVARRYPKQIKHIFIRNVQPGQVQRARFSRAFESLPRNQWTLFGDAGEIKFEND